MSHLKNQLEALEKMINLIGELRAQGTDLDAMQPIMLEARQAIRRAHEQISQRIEGMETATLRQRDAEAYLNQWAEGHISQSEAKQACERLGFTIKGLVQGHGNVLDAIDRQNNGKRVKLYF